MAFEDRCGLPLSTSSDEAASAYREGVEWFYDPKNRSEAIQIALRHTKQKEADLEKTYDFFHRIAFFNKSEAVSKKHLENIMDVLIGFHDIPKRIHRLNV